MNIAVAVPAIHDFYMTPHRASALGALGVERDLRRLGHRVSFFNLLSGSHAHPVPLPEELSYIKPYLIDHEVGPLSFFTSYKRYGISIDIGAQRILSVQPELILISCFAFAYADDTIALADALHAKNRDIPIIVGGPGPSALPEYFTRRRSITAVYCGEAETGLKLMIEHVEQGRSLDNLPQVMTGQSENQIKLPAAAKADQLYFTAVPTIQRDKAVTVSMSLTRGCPKRCSFCSNFITHGRTFRKVPFPRAVQEIDALLKRVEQIPRIHFCFEDDNMLLDTDYFLSILHHIREQRPDATCSAENGIDYLLLDEKLIDTLVDLGMIQFNLSIGSLSPSQLEAARRPYSFRQYERVTAYLSKKGIPAITYFITGLAGDTSEAIVQTLRYLSHQPTTLGISPYYAVPNLPDHTDTSFFLQHTASICKGSSVYPWNELDTEQIVTAFRLSRLINALKGGLHLNTGSPAAQAVQKSINDRRLYTVRRVGHQQTVIEVPRYDRDMVSAFFSS